MGVKGKRPQPGEARPEPRRAKPGGDTNRSLVEIEIALAIRYGFQKNIIAFNVHGESSTLPLFHECDLLVVTRAGYLTEVEIKRTFSDFCADFRKGHRHASGVPVKDFVYCVPEGILDRVTARLERERVVPTRILTYDEDLLFREYAVSFARDDEAGRESRRALRGSGRILLLMEDDGRDVVRVAGPDGPGRPLFIEQQLEVARLGAMRQVSLRERLLRETAEAGKDPDRGLLARVAELETLLGEYRRRYREDTGLDIDENEVLYG